MCMCTSTNQTQQDEFLGEIMIKEIKEKKAKKLRRKISVFFLIKPNAFIILWDLITRKVLNEKS